jgi:hypothetical protein
LCYISADDNFAFAPLKEKIMKKKVLVLSLVLIALVLVPACKKKAAGQLSSEDMLSMLPEGPVVLMAFNFQQFTTLELFDKTFKKNWQKNKKAAVVFKDYQDFVNQTGVDLQKDVYGVVAAVYGSFESKNPELVGIVNLKYDPDKLLAVFKKNGEFTGEETYRDRILYSLKSEDEAKEMRLTFLNQSNIAFGSPLQLKKAIDLNLDKGKSVLQNASMMKYVDKLDKKSMFWLAIGNIPEKMKSAPAGGMMPIDLSKAEAFTAFMNYKGKTFSGELRLISQNEAGNKQIADMLNGLKSLGAMGASKEPELGQLLNSIQLSSAADHVKLTFSISEELMNKLGAKAKEKAQTMAAPASPMEAPAE